MEDGGIALQEALEHSEQVNGQLRDILAGDFPGGRPPLSHSRFGLGD
jgi:hypothetical protein